MNRTTFDIFFSFLTEDVVVVLPVLVTEYVFCVMVNVVIILLFSFNFWLPASQKVW